MSSNTPAGIDPVVLGRAGLNALALAGAAIVARYATADQVPAESPGVGPNIDPSDDSSDDPSDRWDPSGHGGEPGWADPSDPQLPPEMDDILHRAMAAFTDRSSTNTADASSQEAEAVAAMVQHARRNAGRGGRVPLTPTTSFSGMLDESS